MTPKVESSGPELRGGNINLAKIIAPTDVSTRQTKIVCTLGPACWSPEMLETLIDTGLSIARFNFSHGDHETHAATLERLRAAAEKKGKHVGKLKGVLGCECVCHKRRSISPSLFSAL
jgi:pyruvate kinase